MICIEFINVSKKYGKKPAVEGISFQVETGETLALLGPSGCGKTTVLRLAAGLEAPGWGEIRINGKTSSTPEKTDPPHTRSINMVFQDLALWPHMTVAENIDFAMGRGIKGKQERKRKIKDMLVLVRLEEFEDKYPHQLSGGEKQRLALARSLAGGPDILLLDEPLTGLDADLRKSLLKEIKDIICKKHITAVYVTHEWQEAVYIADRVALMDRGKIKQVTASADFAEDYMEDEDTRGKVIPLKEKRI